MGATRAIADGLANQRLSVWADGQIRDEEARAVALDAVAIALGLPEEEVRTFLSNLRAPSRAARTGAFNEWPAVPDANIRFPKRGGVQILTSAGWIQIGTPMWANKDVFSQFMAAGGFGLTPEQIAQAVPTVFIHDRVASPEDGYLPFDFLGYLHFITKGTTMTLATANAQQAELLKAFLDVSYRGGSLMALAKDVAAEYPEGFTGVPNMARELTELFPGPEPETLRQVVAFDRFGALKIKGVTIRRAGEGQYVIWDQGKLLGAVAVPAAGPKTPPAPAAPDAVQAAVRHAAVIEGRPGFWPIGTGHGFDVHGETSGFMNWNQGKVLLIDPPSKTLGYLEAAAIAPDLVDGIIVTHGHTDHFGNSIPRLLRDYPKLKLYATPTVYKMLLTEYLFAYGFVPPAREELISLAEKIEGNASLLAKIESRPDGIIGNMAAFADLLCEVQMHSSQEFLKEAISRYFNRQGMPDLHNWDFKPITPGKPMRINGQWFEFDYTAHPIPSVGFTIWDRPEIESRKLVALFTGDTYASPKLSDAVQKGIMSPERFDNVTRHRRLVFETAAQSPSPIFLIEGGIPPIHTPPEETAALIASVKAQTGKAPALYLYHVGQEAADKAGVGKWTEGHGGWLDFSQHDASWQKLKLEELIARAIARDPFLSSLGIEAQALASLGVAAYFNAGERLMKAGENGQDFSLLIDGAVSISPQEGVVLRRYAGLVGEGALLGEKRNATVTALSPITALTFSAGDPAVQTLFGATGSLGSLRDLRRLRAELLHSSGGEMADLPTAAVDALLMSAQLSHYSPDQVLMERGGHDGDVHYLTRGYALVHKGGQNIGGLTAGQFFGEGPVLFDRCRSATVLAGKRGATSLRIPARTFRGVMNHFPGVAGRLRQSALGHGLIKK